MSYYASLHVSDLKRELDWQDGRDFIKPERSVFSLPKIFSVVRNQSASNKDVTKDDFKLPPKTLEEKTEKEATTNCKQWALLKRNSVDAAVFSGLDAISTLKEEYINSADCFSWWTILFRFNEERLW